MKELKRKQKTALICYEHRQKFAEVHLNTERYWPKAYDWCPECEVWILRNMERQMLGLAPLPRKTIK